MVVTFKVEAHGGSEEREAIAADRCSVLGFFLASERVGEGVDEGKSSRG